MEKLNSLNNTVIVLTGATSGIGRALAKLLANTDAKLVLQGRSEEKMATLIAELPTEKLNDISSECFCLSDLTKITGFITNAEASMGEITHLINCAGANTARGTIDEIKLSDLDEMMNINFRSPFKLMQDCFRLMKPRKDGFIINVLSTVCLYANEGIGAYTASKSALDAMTKVLRKEARRENIKVTSIYPGGVNTAFRTADKPEYLTPESVAQSIYSLLIMPASLITHELVIRPMVEENFA